MRRKRTIVTITVNISHRQREIMHNLRGNQTQAAYIRGLIAEKAAQEGYRWEDEPEAYKLTDRVKE